jgi:signal transduction histidine kinase
MEQQQIVAAERGRIARDLHDGAIQSVYTAGLLVESAQKQVPADHPLASRLEKAMTVLNDAISALRRNLSEMRAVPDDEALPGALRRLAADPRFRSLVDVDLQLNLPGDTALSPAATQHVLAIVSEALSNVVRHARARRVQIVAAIRDGHLSVQIADDGQGLAAGRADGFGLRNMRDRARLLGGGLQMASPPGHGTRVALDVPLNEDA